MHPTRTEPPGERRNTSEQRLKASPAFRAQNLPRDRLRGLGAEEQPAERERKNGSQACQANAQPFPRTYANIRTYGCQFPIPEVLILQRPYELLDSSYRGSSRKKYLGANPTMKRYTMPVLCSRCRRSCSSSVAGTAR